MIRKSRNGDFWLIDGDSHIGAWSESVGRLDHDQNSLPRILPHIPEGGTVVDGGANIGSHTIAYLKKVGVSGEVLAFEPNKEAFDCLRLNCPDAFSFCAALSDDEGTGRLVPNGGTNYGATSVVEGLGDVEMMKLDTLVFKRLDLIKLDVEGFELKALRGACGAISRCRPVLVCEVNSSTLASQGTSQAELFDYIRALNYDIENLYGGKNFDGPQFDIICKPL